MLYKIKTKNQKISMLRISNVPVICSVMALGLPCSVFNFFTIYVSVESGIWSWPVQMVRPTYFAL